MGTRSTIKFYEDNEVLVCIYQQYDGYLSGVGKVLAEFLVPFKMVNGFGQDATLGKTANGMGCLAAQFIAHSKTAVGGLYIVGPDDSQEYNYEVRQLKDLSLVVTVNGDGQLFEGTPAEMLKWIDEDKDEDPE